MYIYSYIHNPYTYTYIHAYIHTHIHIYIHTHIHIYLDTYTHNKYIHTYIHTYLHIYKHMYIHSRIYTYIYTYIIRCNVPHFIFHISKTYTKYLTNYNTLHSPLSAAVYNRHTHALCQHKRHVFYRLLSLAPHLVFYLSSCSLGVSLRPLDCWDGEFESRLRHEYLCHVNILLSHVCNWPILRPV